jgi:SAM-dependent methyltransferase
MMKTYLKLFQSRGIRLVYAYFWNAHFFDLKFKTDTHKMRKLEDINTSFENLENAVAYMVSWDQTLEQSQRDLLNLFENLDGHYFIDYGCGKGKVVLWSLKKDILKIGHRYMGIDFDPSLVAIAKNNARVMHLDEGVFRNANVLDFLDYPEREISFFYNPFDEKILEKLLDKLVERATAVIYVNPVHRQLFLEAGFRSRIRKQSWHANLNYEIFTR